jgi:hypothetical protein
MPASTSACPSDRERAIASIEMLIGRHQAAVAAHELAGEASRASGRRSLIAELRQRLVSIRTAS